MAKQRDQDQVLLTLCYKYSLWLPGYDPNIHPTYPKSRARVGDLGYLTDDGDFKCLFNVCTDASDPFNSGRVPPDFVSLTGIPEPVVEKRLKTPKKKSVSIASSGCQSLMQLNQTPQFEAGRGYEYTCSAPQAAMRKDNNGGKRCNLEFLRLLEAYAAANARSWYKYLNSLTQHQQIRNDTLYLVTGYNKYSSSTSWSGACRSRSPSISLKCSVTGTTGWNDSLCHCNGTPGTPENQTAFWSGYSISVRSDPSFQGSGIGQVPTTRQIPKGPRQRRSVNPGFNKPNADSKLDIPYSHANKQTNTSVDISSGLYKALNPPALINEYILDDFSGARVTPARDRDWVGVARDDQNPFDGEFVNHTMENNSSSFHKLNLPTKNGSVSKGTALCDEPPTPIKSCSTFALIIGIDEYECEEYVNLRAAVSDADRFQKYLLEDLRTPREHIISLRNGQATRKAIIDGFHSLIRDPKIVPGVTAFIIYYAGHGAMAPKPNEWTDWQTNDNEIEILCPTDMGTPDTNGKVVEGIPDRTINELLRELATVKGNNITLILDCCRATSINQNEIKLSGVLNVTPRRILNPPELSARSDPTAIFLGSSGKKITSGFSGSLWGSHVLLAACNRHEMAWEEHGQGLFTRALLETMEKNPVSELTYRSLMHRLVMPPHQTPQLEGKHTLRRLFDSWEKPADSSMILCRHEPEEDRLVLHAGTPHGITVGSTFDIFRTDLPDLQHPLAIATVRKVEAFTSLLVAMDRAFLHADKDRHIWYARLLKDSSASFGTHCNDSNLLTRIIKADCEPRFTVPVTAVQTRGKAHLCLTAKDRSVSFEQGKKINPSIGFPSRFPHDSRVGDTARIGTIIGRFAHFTAQLSITSPLRVTDLISIEMKKLQRDGQSLTPVGENLLPVINDNKLNGIKPIEFFVDKSLPQNQHPRYGFTVRNKSDIDLYVYLFFFDGTSLAIDALYPSKMSPSHKKQGAVDMCFPNDAALGLGYGNSDMNPFMFTAVPDNRNMGVCFYKFIVITQPVDLGSISQSSPFSDSRTPRGLRTVSPSSDLTGSWASIVIPVIQKTAQAVVDLSSKIKSPGKSDPKIAQTVVDPPSNTKSSGISVQTPQAVVGPPSNTNSSGKSVPKISQTVVDPPSKTMSSGKSVQGPRWLARLKNPVIEEIQGHAP